MMYLFISFVISLCISELVRSLFMYLLFASRVRYLFIYIYIYLFVYVFY